MGAVFVVLKGGVTMDREREAPGITNRDGRRWHCQTSREQTLLCVHGMMRVGVRKSLSPPPLDLKAITRYLRIYVP